MAKYWRYTPTATRIRQHAARAAWQKRQYAKYRLGIDKDKCGINAIKAAATKPLTSLTGAGIAAQMDSRLKHGEEASAAREILLRDFARLINKAARKFGGEWVNRREQFFKARDMPDLYTLDKLPEMIGNLKRIMKESYYSRF